MPYTVALPDGRVVEFPDSVPPDKAAQILRQQFPAPSAGFSASDILTSLAQGAVGSTKALTDVAGADNVVSAQLGKAGEALQQRLSPARQAELQRQQDRARLAAESGSTWEEIKAAAQDVAEAPLQSAAQAIGSFAPYIPTMFLGPGAAALGLGARATAAATAVARAAPAALGTAQGAGAVKGAIYERVYEAERADGVPEEEARAKALAAQEYAGKNLDQILLGAGAGYVAGRFGAERLLTPGAAATAERSVLGRVGTALATDIPTEAFQGGQERLATNIALQREGRDVPTFQGVAGQAVQEGLLGALGSAPVAAIRGPGDVRRREDLEREAAEATRRQAETEAAAAQQALYRQTPEYVADLEQRFADVKRREAELAAATKGKIDRSDPLAVEERRRASEALSEFKKSDEYTTTLQEYTDAFDVLRPRALERQRAERVAAAPEGAQLEVFGEPGAVTDQTLPGRIKALETFATSFDKPIDAAKKAGDTQQVALLQQQQAQARQQLTTLLPDPQILQEARFRAQQRLEDYQTQIKDLSGQETLKPAQYTELTELNNTAKQIRQAIGDMDSTLEQIQRQGPTEVLKPINKEAERAKLQKKLAEQGTLGEDIGATLEKLQALEQIQEQPSLFGEEDLRPVATRDLGDIIADERERVKALREKLDAERAALQRIAATPVTSRTDEIERRRKELVEEARKTAEQIRQQNQDLTALDQLNKNLTQLGSQLQALQAQNKPIPEGLTARIARTRQSIDVIKTRLGAQQPVAEGQRTLAEFAPGEERPVSEGELTTQRDRDIEALLDQYLAPALGVKETKETLTVQGPEGEREVRLTSLGGKKPVTATQIDDVAEQREELVTAYETEFEPAVREARTDSERREALRNANRVRANIAELVNVEADLRRQRAGGKQLSEDYRTDLEELVLSVLDRRAAAVPGTTTDEQLDSLVVEFSEVSPQDAAAAKRPLARVAKGRRPAALPAAELLSKIAANENQIKQIRQDLKYAGRPTDPEKVAARDKLVAELQPLLTETKNLRDQYNKLEAAPAPKEETGEVAEMRQELATIERTLASDAYKGSAKITQQLETARDELRGRIEAAVGPQRPEAEPEQVELFGKVYTPALLPGMAQRFAQFEQRPVAPGALAKAKTDYVKATQKIEDIRQALGRLDEMGPKYFQEVATTYQQNIDAANRQKQNLADTLSRLGKDLAGAKPEDAPALQERINNIKEQQEVVGRNSKALVQAEAEVKRFLNLAKLAGTSGAQNLRPSLERAMSEAEADKDKKEAAVKELEKRQRMYEQQEAAKRGVELGEVEAEKITAGEVKGFVSGRGKALAEKPKSKRSWVISTDSKAKMLQPGQAGKLAAATQSAFDLLAEAKKETSAAATALKGAPTPEQLAPLKLELKGLEARIAESYSPEQATAIADEIQKLRERLAALTPAPKIADVSAAYARAANAKTGTPAYLRVQQLQWRLSSAALKTGAELRAAEQAVAAQEKKYEDLKRTYKQAEKRLGKLKDAKKLQGVRLQMDNLYALAGKLRDNIADAINVRSAAENKYMAAHLEQLLLTQQIGDRAKEEAANLTARLAGAADTVTTLTKERDAAMAREAQIRSKLTAAEAAAEKAAEDAKNAKDAARNAERKANEKARNDAMDAAAAARAQAERIRSGLGLPGVRVERDTAGQLMTAAQADIKQRLATAETNLGKAMRSGDTAAIKDATAKVEETARELDQVFAKAPITTTEIGAAQEAEAAAEDVFQPEPVEGLRLPTRREGPAVRYTRGGSKAVMQSGAVKLRAEGLSQEAANAVSLFVAKNRIAGAKKADTKEKYQKAYDDLIAGIPDEQVSTMLAEGKRLMGLGPTPELIAKRVAYQDALAAVTKAEQDVKAAKTGVTKELAQDALELAAQRRDSAENAYAQAKAMYETSQIKTAKKAAKETVESLLSETEDKDEDELPISRLASAVGEDLGDLTPMVYTTATRTESNPAVREAILDGRLLDALDRLAVEGANDLIRQTAKEIRSLVLRTKVLIDPNLTVDGKAVPAAYSGSRNAVAFRPDAITDEDIIHEVTHAATMRVLTMPDAELTPRQRNAKKELEAIFKQLGKNKKLLDEYGLENIKEFVSEVQSNVEFRAAIDQQPWYKRLWHAIVRLFSDAPIETVSDRASRLVREIYLPSQKITEPGTEAASIFRREAKPSSSMVGRPAGALKTLEGNLFGLAGRVQLVDRLGAAEEGFVRAQNAGVLSSLEAENAQYFMRLGDMTTQAAGQFITTGPVGITKDKFNGRQEERYESRSGPTLVRMAEFIERAAAEGLGTAEDVETMLTVKVAGDRANAIPRGWERLMAGDPAKAKAEYNAAIAKINANPAAKKFVDAAIAEYKAYNDGLIDFVQQTDFLSADEAKRLKQTPYVPFYRIENGEVKLFIDRELPVTIGNIKDNPDLQRLIGDNKQILPILTSAVQNTFMLTRAGLRNKATLETASALEKAGFVTKMGAGAGLANVNTVHYKYKGKPYFATIDADQFGIPAELIVRGMEGIKTNIPEMVRLLGIPANWLRTFITRLPAYALRQMVRDPLNAAIVGGVDGVPVLNALKQFAKMQAGRNPAADELMRGLVVSSNIYTGDSQDMTRFLEAASTGRGKWSKLMGQFDQVALASDAATRSAIYEDGLSKGLSKRQAQFRALESQNFSRRGLSPGMQMLSTLVPFFNAQIQGLDVLYRSFRGKMPFSQKLEIQKKIVSRGIMLMVTAMSYAFLMRDNEEYQKATPEERYANFFVPLPNSKQMIKVPIPYEVGLLFKALPEAVVDAMMGDTKAKEAATGIGKLLLQSAPGVIPAAGKPLIEAAYGQTMIGPIESEREQRLPAGQRFREMTPEALKTLGSFTGSIGLSPLMLEHLVRGYTSSMGISMLRMLDPVLASATEGESATAPLSKLPFVGGLFQTPDGRFLVNRAYSRMEEIQQAVEGYKDLEKRGQRAEATEYAQRKADLLAAADMAGLFRQKSGELFTAERAIRADVTLTREQKDALLEKVKAAQQEMARQFYRATERTAPQ